ncbi:MAG: molybdate ABC transporter permease subunit [Verrucomicrobiales bacterium]
MNAEDWELVTFTAGVAALSTALIVPPGLVLAWLLARKDWRGKALVETLVALPLVLPPVATGLLLLKLLGRRGPIGRWLHETFDVDIVFTWRAVAVALSVMSFPLFARAARSAFESVGPRFEQVAATLGAAPMRVFFTVTLPLAFRGLAAGVLLAFARALGEFGATIVLAGNIPGETTTLSMAIYQSIQLGEDDRAMHLLIISAILAFGAVALSEYFIRRANPRP